MPLVIWCVGDCIDSVDCIWYYSNFKYWFFLPRNMEYSPSVYVIFDFFHQCLIIFFVQFFCLLQFSSVQLLSRVWLFVTPWTTACQASLSITNSRSSIRLMSIESVMPFRQSHLRSSPSPAAPNPSQHQSLFQWVNSLHEVAKYWSFSFSIIPSKEHPELISFRMDWLDLLAVQGTLKSLLQHHSSKASILWPSAFFTV